MEPLNADVLYNLYAQRTLELQNEELDLWDELTTPEKDVWRALAIDMVEYYWS